VSLPAPLVHAAKRTVDALRSAGATISIAESCTGGLIAAALTSVPGASTAFGRGWVTYANDAKIAELGVAEELLASFGAISAECAAAMATGALARAGSAIAVTATGIAGPDGGTADKPVGLVFIAAAAAGAAPRTRELRLSGDRDSIREQTAVAALNLAAEALPQ
jgi:PncC family amidohydrolase